MVLGLRRGRATYATCIWRGMLDALDALDASTRLPARSAGPCLAGLEPAGHSNGPDRVFLQLEFVSQRGTTPLHSEHSQAADSDSEAPLEW